MPRFFFYRHRGFAVLRSENMASPLLRGRSARRHGAEIVDG